MGENSGISWCDNTFNPWIGCRKIAPACDHCYAARDNDRFHWVPEWGDARKRTSAANWEKPLAWNRKAQQTGYRPKVFVASLADVFDNEVPDEYRIDLWQLMEETPFLRWMPLTKRIGNVNKMVPLKWMAGQWPQHVGIMATMSHQEEWDRDYHKLMAVPAPWRGVSVEPMLGSIDIGPLATKYGKCDWVITGGESGEERRELDMDAVRWMMIQCDILEISYHHKQNGGLKGTHGGCLIDGVEYKAFPPQLQ